MDIAGGGGEQPVESRPVPAVGQYPPAGGGQPLGQLPAETGGGAGEESGGDGRGMRALRGEPDR